MTVDRTAAVVAISSQALANDTGASNSDLMTADGRVTLTGTVEAGATVAIYDGSTKLGDATLDGSGGWTFSTVLQEGSHTLHAEATDLAGNTKSTSPQPTITVTPPVKILSQTLAHDNGSLNTDLVTNDGSVTLTGTVEA